MTTRAQPIDVPASRGLIAAAILILGLGVFAVGGHLVSRAGWTQEPSTGAPVTEPVAEWGD